MDIIITITIIIIIIKYYCYGHYYYSNSSDKTTGTKAKSLYVLRRLPSTFSKNTSPLYQVTKEAYMPVMRLSGAERMKNEGLRGK